MGRAVEKKDERETRVGVERSEVLSVELAGEDLLGVVDGGGTVGATGVKGPPVVGSAFEMFLMGLCPQRERKA